MTTYVLKMATDRQRTMEHRQDVGLDSYDRFIPNQDTLPQGGFGNLIALPLQKKVRDLGNSVFVNEDLIAYEDQWAFLSSLNKITRQEAETIVNRAEGKGLIVGTHLRSFCETFNPVESNTMFRCSPDFKKHLIGI
jgi:hypothetical protein